MLQTSFFTILIILAFSAVLGYRVSFLHTKKIGYFSFLQFLYLIVLPGIFYTTIFFYVMDILSRPTQGEILLPDSVIIPILFLAMIYSYGGIAIHSTAKMLSTLPEIRYRKFGKAHKMNKFFHLTFSHNIVNTTAIMILTCLSFLELNHIPPLEDANLGWAIFKGLLVGFSIVASLYFYTRSKDDYSGKWADLKAFFITFWILFVLFLYAIQTLNPQLGQYQAVIPTLLGMSCIAFLNAILAIRKLKDGNLHIYVRFGNISKKIFHIVKSPLTTKQNPQQ